MKYLRKFNESKNGWDMIENFDNLQKFCNQYLIYLLDEGFELDYDDDEENEVDHIEVYLFKKEYREIVLFTWDDIKDHYIPFLTLLKEKFDVEDYIYFYYADSNDNLFNSPEEININTLIDNNFKNVIDIKYICVNIKK